MSDYNIDFNRSLIVSFFQEMERQGPGCNRETRRALQFISPLNIDSKILDIGSGTGRQTAVLAAETSAQILATDLSSEMLDRVVQNTAEYGDRVQVLIASMDKLPLEGNSFDLIWAEGAAYVIGFENALGIWNKFLKINGMIALSEISWLTVKRPGEIDRYWKTNYPELDTISENIKKMEQNGYAVIAHFVLSEDAWTTYYYDLMEKRIQEYEKEHFGNMIVRNFLAEQKKEIAMYHTYKDYFGFVFYIGRKL